MQQKMRSMTGQLLLLLVLLAAATMSNAFAPSSMMTSSASSSTRTFMSKGFGSVPEPKKTVSLSEGAQKRQAAAKKYDEIASMGGQEYNIFVRQFGSDDNSWFPCGAICVPRGEQVSNAIFANEEALKVAIVRTYPKLKGFEAEFEFGSNLKLYPDDPVEVATKRPPPAKGLSFGNWINTLLSPMDVSAVKSPPTPPSSQ